MTSDLEFSGSVLIVRPPAQIANRIQAARTGIPSTLAAVKAIAEAG